MCVIRRFDTLTHLRRLLPMALALSLSGCSYATMQTPTDMSDSEISDHAETAVFGGGCFWCVEAVFQWVDGVLKVESGYAGGHVPNPTYQQVLQKDTGHAEVVQITYDPKIVSYEQLLNVFWQAHDPTTLNRQGADVGPQYRSIILAKDEAQKAVAERSKANVADLFDDPIVTEIDVLETFYAAELYHQDYFRNNPNAGYCRFVIAPKLEKLKKADVIR